MLAYGDTHTRFLFVSQDKSFEKSVFWASLFLFFKFGYVCMCVRVCQHHYGGRRTTFGSQFSTSTMWSWVMSSGCQVWWHVPLPLSNPASPFLFCLLLLLICF